MTTPTNGRRPLPHRGRAGSRRLLHHPPRLHRRLRRHARLRRRQARRAAAAAVGPASSGARATPDDAATAGRNRIHLVVDDLDAEIDRLRDAGLTFRSEPVSGPGGRQILIADPAGNLVELFQPAPR
ncbi:VOC family protein [Actinomadura kijaniata]